MIILLRKISIYLYNCISIWLRKMPSVDLLYKGGGSENETLLHQLFCGRDGNLSKVEAESSFIFVSSVHHHSSDTSIFCCSLMEWKKWQKPHCLKPMVYDPCMLLVTREDSCWGKVHRLRTRPRGLTAGWSTTQAGLGKHHPSSRESPSHLYPVGDMLFLSHNGCGHYLK